MDVADSNANTQLLKEVILENLFGELESCFAFEKNCNVEGILAITVDQKKVFVLNFQECLEKESLQKTTPAGSSPSLTRSKRKRKNASAMEHQSSENNHAIQTFSDPSTFNVFTSNVNSSLVNANFSKSVDHKSLWTDRESRKTPSHTFTNASQLKGLNDTNHWLGAGDKDIHGALNLVNGSHLLQPKGEKTEMALSDKNDNQIGTVSFNTGNESVLSLPSTLSYIQPSERTSDEQRNMQWLFPTIKSEPVPFSQLTVLNGAASLTLPTTPGHPNGDHAAKSSEKRNRRKSHMPMKVTSDSPLVNDEIQGHTIGISGLQPYIEQPQEGGFVNGTANLFPGLLSYEEPAAQPSTAGKAPRSRRGKGKRNIRGNSTTHAGGTSIDAIPQPTFDVNGKPELYCKACDKTFKSKEGWKIHMERHAGRSRYFCPYCQRGFMAQTHLKAHLSEHTQKFAFVCDLCGEGFKYLFTKNKHTCAPPGSSSKAENHP